MNKKLNLYSPRLGFIFLFLAILLAGSAELFQHRREGKGKAQVIAAEENLSKLKAQMIEALDLLETVKTEEEYHNFFIHSGFEKTGFSFFITKENKVIYWSDNEPAVGNAYFNGTSMGKFIALPNGDFLAFSKNVNGKKYSGLILLKHNYDYENKYLVNEFNPCIGLSAAFTVASSGNLVFHLPDGSIGYHLNYDIANESGNSIPNIIYLFALIFGLTSFFILIRLLFQKSFLYGLVGIAIIWAVRTLLIIFRIPDEFYRLQLFSPQLYASSFYFNSLGDFVINAIVLLIVAINFYLAVSRIPKKLFLKMMMVIGIVTIAAAFHQLTSGLIINSRISFDVSSALKLNQFSLWAFLCFAILACTFLLFLATTLKYFFNYKIQTKHVWLAIALCSAYAALNLKSLNQFKEHEERKQLAQKIGVRRDHVAEYLFDEARKKMQNDTALTELIDKNENISAYIIQKYLTGYLARFESTIYVFSAEDDLKQNKGFSLANFRYRARRGKSTGENNLYFLSSETGRSSYLSFIPLGDPDVSVYTIVIEFSGRFLQSEEGFPELFISGRSNDNYFPEEYSFARYSGHSLIYEFGSYTYSLTDKDFEKDSVEFSFTDLHGFSHMVYRVNANSSIIVSKQNENLFTLLTLFSWMFGIFGITVLIIYLLSFLFDSDKFSWNLTRRIQVSVVSIVVLSFILVGAGTVIYIDRKYQEDERKSISDQVNALWFMITENALPFFQTVSQNDLENSLTEIVNNTNIDFNLFDPSGELLFSSQPKIYDQNIISRRMNPEALFEIKKDQLTQFINPENAGNLKYISAYAPLTDQSGNIKAYLSLPYFEKQNELNKEVSGFLSALLNIYVLLLAIAVLLTVIISSRITKPLLLIQQKISKIRLGSVNEHIAYQRNDEIGQLVQEYNRMLDELSSSADKLAKSERELAWREMAKQVAHEIKNPLTPMKLSVQHLQRTLQQKNEADKAFVDRISTTLIQQIDTLSNIATAFSDFAQMPNANPKNIHVTEILLPLVDLYREIPELEIVVNNQFESDLVLADKDHLNRIFSNILKNALQSIPDDRKGKIEVDVRNNGNDIQIIITDNGIGISDDKKDKIFIPNFTTKSSGMGLGLAMVKDLVDQSGGKVSFNTKEGEWTSFIVSLPTVG